MQLEEADLSTYKLKNSGVKISTPHKIWKTTNDMFKKIEFPVFFSLASKRSKDGIWYIIMFVNGGKK